MGDATPPAGGPARTRPDFVVPPGQGGGTSAGGGATYEFFGPTVINAPVAGGDQYITAGHGDAERAYLFQVADVYRIWRNQYILGPASAQSSPFITTDTAALVRRLVAGPARGSLVRRPVALAGAINLYRQVLLLGKPGAGKSSYLQYLALQCTDPAAGLGLLPVLVDLSDYDADGGPDPVPPLLDFFRGFLRNPPNLAPPEAPIHVESPWLADALEDYLQQGRILLLLDGLNELAPAAPDRTTARRAALQAFFAAYPRVRTVVTCRQLDYTGALDSMGFQTVLLDPWTIAQMTAYLQERGDAFLLARLQAGDALISSLGQIPFLLYMLSELSANYPPPADATTPSYLSSQSALFGQFMELLLDWATLKDRANAALFPRQVVVAGLARLAAAMQVAGYRGTPVPRDWAGQQVAPDPATLFAGVPPGGLVGDPRGHLIDFGCEATILDAPATGATVHFWHLTHQDYFAALLAPPGTALTPAADDLHTLAAAVAPQPAAAIGAVLQQPDPRAPLVAAKALLAVGGS